MTEFREIAHSGGKITFEFMDDGNGQRLFSVGVTTCSINPQVLVGVYALEHGIPVAPLHLGGLGVQMNPPPFTGCLPVLIQSDSEGHFGHNCPRCGRRRKSEPPYRPNIEPGVEADVEMVGCG